MCMGKAVGIPIHDGLETRKGENGCVAAHTRQKRTPITYVSHVNIKAQAQVELGIRVGKVHVLR